MTGTWFHKGLYRDFLRQLRVPAVVMLLLFTVFEAFAAVSLILEGYFGYYSFNEMHPSLYVMPYIVPLVLVLMALHYQHTRRDSDFYHSLPVSKLGISLSALAAAVTWTVLLIAASSLVLWLLGILTPLPLTIESFRATEIMYERSFVYMLREVGAAMLSALMMVSLVFLAAMLCGTLLSTLSVTAILMFAPFLLYEILMGYALDRVSYIYPYGHLFDGMIGSFDYTFNIFGYNLLLSFGAANGEVGVWIATAVWTVVLMAVGILCARRRPSETAGASSVSPVMQTSFRILLTLACSLPAVMLILEGDAELLSLGLIYLFATAVYFLYELFTTRKVKNLVKAIPWNAVFVVLHIACILGVHAGSAMILNYRPAADDIRGVSVVSIDGGYYLENYVDVCIRSSKLERYAELYAESDSSKAVVEDNEAKSIVCNALRAGCIHTMASRGNGWYGCNDQCGGVCEQVVPQYTVTVAIYDGMTKHIREIHLADEDMRTLMGAVNEVEPLPVLSPGGFAAYSPLVK